MKKNIANIISALRLILSPIIIYLLMRGSFGLAASLYMLGLFTDVVDGYIARSLKTATEFGKNWDPITSVVLFYSVSFTLAFLGYIPWLYPILIGVYSFIAIFLIRISTNENFNSVLEKLNTFIGAGIGDLGLGLILVNLFCHEYLWSVIVLSTVIFLLKNYLQKNNLLHIF